MSPVKRRATNRRPRVAERPGSSIGRLRGPVDLAPAAFLLYGG